MKIGVLALQGGFARHIEAFSAAGFPAAEVRDAAGIASSDALVIPGGESTVMNLLLNRHNLWVPLTQKLASGAPCMGTCAGMILLSSGVDQMGQKTLGLMDFRVRRNAYGNQIESFEAPVDIHSLGSPPFPGVFIRAPRVLAAGPGCEILASFGDSPVMIRQGRFLAMSFHPELTNDHRIHDFFGHMCVETVAGTTKF